MRVLIDTHVFLWWAEGDRALPTKAHEALAAPETDCLLSMVSVWELTIKAELGKLRLALPVSRYITEQVAVNGFRLLGIELRHIAGLEGLAFHHRDPFDRLLVAQALAENLPVITADSIFGTYGVGRIWA